MAQVEGAEALRQLLGFDASPPEPFPYDEAGLLIASILEPGIDPDGARSVLDGWASAVAAMGPEPDDARRRLALFRRVLYEDAGFRGDRGTYYDLRNSVLPRVIERRLGIPITLAMVMLGVARRLGWGLQPVGFPAHFLVRVEGDGQLLAFDPFDGLILGREELVARWTLATGARPPRITAMLAPAPPHAVIVRTLNNARLVHLREARYTLAATVTGVIAVLEPGDPIHDRDQAVYYLAGGRREEAAHHLRRYMRRVPAAPVPGALRGLLNEGSLRP